MIPAEYHLSEDRDALQMDVIHGYLAQSYWSPGIPRETLERAVAGSHIVGAYHRDEQVGFARLITDHATFAYLADVFVLEAHRGKGIARAMVAHLQAHPELQGLRRWLLATRDAHPIYASLGWTALRNPDNFMERHDPEVYAR